MINILVGQKKIDMRRKRKCGREMERRGEREIFEIVGKRKVGEDDFQRTKGKIERDKVKQGIRKGRNRIETRMREREIERLCKVLYVYCIG